MAGAQDEDKTEILGGRHATGQADLADTVIDAAISGDDTTQLECPPRDAGHDSASTTGGRRVWGVLAVLLVVAGLLAWQWLHPRPRPGVDHSSNILPTAVALAEASLRQNSPEMLPSQLLAMQQRYPDNPGLSDLLADSNHYLYLLELLARGKVLTLAQQRAEMPFKLPLFSRAAAQNIDPLTPPADLVQQLRTAEANWHRGELVQAMEAARQLAQTEASDQATALLDHYTRVVTAYQDLSGVSGAPDYPSHLLAFYLALDPLRDRFYWQRLQADFDTAGQAPEEGPQAQLHSAGQQWLQYQQRGGIDAARRQQAALHQDFSSQARLLANIHGQLRTLAVMAAESASQAPLLQRQVNAEITLQRQRLQALLAHNEDTLLAEKLAMLPTLDQQLLQAVDK